MIYDYIYYHFFDLISKYRKTNARESALLYISIIVYFLTLPLIILPLHFHLMSNLPSIFFILLCLGYAGIIYFFNKRYFEKSKRIRDINKRFISENLLQRRVGYMAVILVLLSSFILFFFFLSIL
jgi:hypothetical protein